MPLSIETGLQDDIAVLQLHGSLTLGPSLVSLRNAAREILAKPKLAGIILDLSSVIAVDSSGLGELTIVYSSTSRRNCGMILVGVSASLHKMLQMTHLDAVFTSTDNVDNAKKKLKQK